jgi:hypothetical protein
MDLPNPSEKLSERSQRLFQNLVSNLKKGPKGPLVGSLLQLAKGAGILPKFEDLDEAETHAMLTSLMELIRMIRDGDPDTFDDRAREIYADLNAPR